MKLPLFLQKEKTRLVKTFVWHTSISGNEIMGKFYIYLFETNKGNRSVELDTTHIGIGDLWYVIKQYEVYHDTIYPWLKGKYDPTIPSYERSIEIDEITERNKVVSLKLVEN